MKKFRSSRIACTCSRRPYLAALQAAAVRARLPSGLRGQVVPGSHGLQPPGILCAVQPAPGQVIMSISGAAASACSCTGVPTHACPFVLPIGLRLILQEEVWFGMVRSSSFRSRTTGCAHTHMRFLGVSGIQARPVVVLEGQVYGILYLLMNDFSTICTICVHPACTSDTLSMLHRPIDNFNHGRIPISQQCTSFLSGWHVASSYLT